MEAYYENDSVQLYLDTDSGCLAVLPSVPDASVDAVVCDPPYELGFMGKAWDSSGIAYNTEVWRQCWRVLKPGGHLVAFGGTRTYHRMTVAIEDAGFEIRDSLHWIYGSGFPKGQDIAKSIDKRRDDREQVLQVTAWLAAAREAAGWSNKQIEALFGFKGNVGNLWTTQGKAAMVPSVEQWDRLREALGFNDAEIRPVVVEVNARKNSVGENWAQREVIGSRSAGLHQGSGNTVMLAGSGTALNADGSISVTAPASDAARQWQGWNTALKPAHEPIVLARKSTGFNTTVANVLEHGTGALNIDGCRTESNGPDANARRNKGGHLGYSGGVPQSEGWDGGAGRWPTNILLAHPPLLDGDGRPVGDACASGCVPGCPVAEMDAQSGVRKAGERPANREGLGYMGNAAGAAHDRGVLDSGGASRFFPVFRYEAKAPASERPRLADGTAHATVKPLALMRWLVRLVTPPSGTVLDPFAGSGTTLEACRLESFQSIGIEMDAAHAELCRIRLDKPYMVDLFGGGAA